MRFDDLVLKKGLFAFRTKLLFFIFLCSSYNIYSQCSKKKYCPKKDLGEYDYDFGDNPSSYAFLSPGDTCSFKTVVYGGYDYRILICSDPKLGHIHFFVNDPERKVRKIIKEIQESEIIDYKLDEYGEVMYDDNWEPIELGRTTVYDTIWGTESYFDEIVIYDNYKDPKSQNYWEGSIRRDQTLQVKVIVPQGDIEIDGCVDVLIGRIKQYEKKFIKYD